MSKKFAFVLAAGVAAALAPSAASAADYDERYEGYGHINRDRQRLSNDAAQVREERAELNAAQRRLHRAWYFGDYWGAKKAQHDVREEREELAEARRKYNRQAEDIREDREHAYGYRHRRHWWRYWE